MATQNATQSCQFVIFLVFPNMHMQGWTVVSKAARENVLNGPKFAKTIYLSIDNRPSKLRFGTALVLRMSSGVNLGEVVDPGKKNRFFQANFRKFQFFSGPFTQIF